MNSPNSDIIVDIKSIKSKQQRKQTRNFSEIYKDKVFYIWYNHGKPQEGALLKYVPEDLDEWERLPTISTLKSWIDHEFVLRGKQLDEQIKTAMDAAMVIEKVEMLKRHAKLGLDMQDMAIKYLNQYSDVISGPAAVRLLVEGIRIERESRGIPAALEKITKMTDEELLEQVKGLLTAGKMEAEESNANSGHEER